MCYTGKICTLALLLYVQSVYSWTPDITNGQIWPLPQYINYVTSHLVIEPRSFSFKITGETCDVVQLAVDRYLYTILHDVPQSVSCDTSSNSGSTLDTVSVQLNKPCEQLPHLHMDEQYELHVNTEGYENVAVISSDSVWGVLRGLETFSQLVTPSTDQPGCLVINSTDVLDYPRFPHRGLLIDTARHYLPVHTIYNMLDAMEMNKMNVLHWHIVDDQSFPYQSYSFPSLSEQGAYSPSLVYTQQDVKSVIEYARVRGIRVVPEFDSPGHTQAWGKGIAKLLTPCYSQGKLDGTFGPVDPTKPKNYKFMKTLLQEVKDVFPDDYIHIGGDEIDYSCWESNPHIIKFMKQKHMATYDLLEAYYIKHILHTLVEVEASGIVWQEVFQHNATLRNDTVVHIWLGNRAQLLNDVTAAGLFALTSESWYLDHINDQWENFYVIDPQAFNGTKAQQDLVMGGEACMWGEMVDEDNIAPRVWPRTSAIAERLWSSQGVNNATLAAPRINEHVCRMKRRGVAAQPGSGPGFCPTYL